ncbi:MAG: FIG01121868: Possible membrane protein, Rv0205 [uncultured Nocardioidaceae bacterium]|uniref:FIG01121868: Possible membrane protein, Rv0205 n=1 Tax=uncultured Nocardioidaceae bacterium TaxID=253824 RepID=A0A6J4LV00_9ACTN|nr:MAG: FIG01121868: Possible membrane protein, Rv0205 [uncultured Nocardioidaceae bacterium]
MLSRLRHRDGTDPAKLTEEQFERRFSAQFHKAWAQHWAELRSERRHDEGAPRDAGMISPGQSNFRRAEVPYGVDLAAAWSWRFIVIVAAGFLIAKAVGFLSLVVMPVVIALFIAALVQPLVAVLSRVFARGAATALVVLGLLGVVALMLTFATQQVVQGATDLSDQVVDGLEQIRTWLTDGPLNASDAQIQDAIQQAQSAVTSSNAEIVNRLTDVSTTIGHVVAGFFIVLFATYFFLADGRPIWAWVVRLFPRAARARVDASGQVAWLSLTAFVRATVLVALVDAIGIMIVAAILKVPFVVAIGVLVFLTAFIPMVGATISGVVAVLVALVAQGPITALLMLAGVVAVQQIEAQVLQPFLLGRMVRVHPLAVILAVASGVYLAGIAGALVAVPLAAAVNSVAVYLASSPPEAGQPGRDDLQDAAPDVADDSRHAGEERASAVVQEPDDVDAGPLADKPHGNGAPDRSS